MSTYAIGDIHGCFDALITLISFIQPGEDDTVVFLGDYIDRGPDSNGVIEWIHEESKRGNFICLRGNHELMMLESRHNPAMLDAWLACGGRASLESYGWTGGRNWPELIPDHHWQFIERTRPHHENEATIFVHAMLHPNLPLHEHDEFQLYWEKCHELHPHESGKRVIVGHTRQTSGIPREFAGGVCIDTACVSGQWLTALNAETGEYFQANQAGENRRDRLGNR